MKKLCKQCSKPISTKRNFPSDIKIRTYCSVKCSIPDRSKKRKIGAFKKCKHCNKTFYVKKCLLERSYFCSKKCTYLSFRGKSFSPNTEFKTGAKHPFYKGNEAVKYLKGYSYLHTQLRKEWGTPSYCEFCKKTNSLKYSWANITGIYNKDPKNWKRLCQSCHIKHDLVK